MKNTFQISMLSLQSKTEANVKVTQREETSTKAVSISET